MALHMTTVKSSGLFNKVPKTKKNNIFEGHIIINTCLWKAIMESEPIKITLKDRRHALRLGEDFSKELGMKILHHFKLLFSYFFDF